MTIDHNVGFMDVSNCMCEVLASFKVLVNFEVYKFDELAFLGCPTIHDNARSTDVERVMSDMST